MVLEFVVNIFGESQRHCIQTKVVKANRFEDGRFRCNVSRLLLYNRELRNVRLLPATTALLIDYPWF